MGFIVCGCLLHISGYSLSAKKMLVVAQVQASMSNLLESSYRGNRFHK